MGHDRAVRLLQGSIDAGRVSHAYLLSGPRHVGKATLAREFAKALNCTHSNPPCGECLSCRKIESSVHPDVRRLEIAEGAKNLGIDSVRDIQAGVALRPFEGRVKLYIIEDAERLSEPAANSLLKTLEEPPPSVVLVLTTLDAMLLLPTLVSRCQRIDLRPVPAATIESALLARQVDSERATLISVLARGRHGWALRAASNPTMLDRRAELLDRLAGLPAASRVGRLAFANELATMYGRDSEAGRGVLETWQSWWRDLLLVRLGLTDLLVNVDRVEQLQAEVGARSVAVLARTVAAIQSTISLLAQNVNARLALEVLMLSIPAVGGKPGIR